MDGLTVLFLTIFCIFLDFKFLFAKVLLEPKIISTPEIVVVSTLVEVPILEEILDNSFLMSFFSIILTPDIFKELVELDFIILEFID